VAVRSTGAAAGMRAEARLPFGVVAPPQTSSENLRLHNNRSPALSLPQGRFGLRRRTNSTAKTHYVKTYRPGKTY